MYHPFLRGKQNELILLRENAKLLANSSIVPIIEPVKSNLISLNKAIKSLKEENTQFILIVNPRHGDFKNDPLPIFENTINSILKDYENFCIGYIIDSNSNLLDVENFLKKNHSHLAIIHNGFPNAKKLGEILNKASNIKKHIFLDDQILYRRHFDKDIDRVLIRDGFKKNRNKDYPQVEHFSELHLTYDEMNMNGFGDFLIVGNEYSESGGPAYAIAIHLTYLNEDKDMYIRHFISDRTDTPTDPAGKFAEALNKLVEKVEEDEQIYKSDAYLKYKEYHDKGHFPGLGYAKKLSMQHHIETIAKFLKE